MSKDDFITNKTTRKFMNSVGRAMHFVVPTNDREAELMYIAYIGAMNKAGLEVEEIAKIAIGIKNGWAELLKITLEA